MRECAFVCVCVCFRGKQKREIQRGWESKSVCEREILD